MKENEIKNTTEKRFTIMGLSVWRILAYFIIYSVVGYIIETIFGIITKGTWESRQSFLIWTILCYIWCRSIYNDYVIAQIF